MGFVVSFPHKKAHFSALCLPARISLRTSWARIPSPSQLCKRWQAAGALPFETLFVLTVWGAVRTRFIGADDLIIDSTPILT
jgi:hypothetical protein